ncbi:CinA family protein [Sandaracinobacteroides hominis]|uniref:CinA family protein n=1 Tax=Sandaracinobacteroides hominis TaxID=2780086 RepID=UPI0018F5D452|nr:CinA family protein [Sandaracinobacteroides hominis]
MSFEALVADAEQVAALLKARHQSIAVAESSTGGLISAALLAVPGASSYYYGGGVVYTPRARHRLLDLKREEVRGLRSASEPYALALAERTRTRFKTSWAIGETGASGPSGNPYGDAAGHCCLAVHGPGGAVARTLETGRTDRLGNMYAFAAAAFELLRRQIEGQP